jgi:hypothetical protein
VFFTVNFAPLALRSYSLRLDVMLVHVGTNVSGRMISGGHARTQNTGKHNSGRRLFQFEPYFCGRITYI